MEYLLTKVWHVILFYMYFARLSKSGVHNITLLKKYLFPAVWAPLSLPLLRSTPNTQVCTLKVKLNAYNNISIFSRTQQQCISFSAILRAYLTLTFEIPFVSGTVSLFKLVFEQVRLVQ